MSFKTFPLQILKLFYLRKENYARIKKNIRNIRFFHGPVQSAVSSTSCKFDGFNLSDIFEYLNDSTCEDIYGILLEHSKPGARFVYWNMLVPRSCPAKLRERVACLEEFSAELFGRDKAFFYSRFIVEEVK